MKRSVFIVLALVFVFSVVMGSFGSASAETIKLRWSHVIPKNPDWAKLYDWFFEEVKKRTNGRVEFKMFWSGTLCGIKEQAEFVKNGMADVAYVTPAYHPGYGDLMYVFTANDFFYDGSGVTFMKKWMQFTDQFPAFRDSLAKQNIIPIAYRWYDAFQIWSKKPIDTLDDLKGIKIRALGKVQQAAYKAVGAVPMYVSATEVYGALQKNILTGLSMSVENGKTWKVQKILKHLTMAHLLSGAIIWSMNLDKFKALTPEDQKTLLEMGRELTIRIAEKVESQRDSLLEDLKKTTPDLEVRTLSEAEREKWQRMPEVKKYQEMWVTETEAAGLPAKDALKMWRKILAE